MTRGSIVFLVSTFEPAVGGTVRQTANQARALRRRGFDVTVLTRRHDDELPATEERDGVRVVRVGPRGLGAAGKLWALCRWAGFLRRRRGELVAVQAVMHPDFLLSAALAGVWKRAALLWVTDGDAQLALRGRTRARRPLAALRRFAVRRVANVVLTPGMADELRGFGVSEPRVIPVPVDLDRFRPAEPDHRRRAREALGVDERQVVVAFSGHIEPRKRLDRLIGAQASLVRAGRELHLLIVGGDPNPGAGHGAELQRLASERGVRERVTVTGAVPDVREPLAAADVFALVSDREGMPNCLLEAMACGIPCVAPPSAGGHELLATGGGRVPPSNDLDAIEQALRELVDDGELRRDLGARARDVAGRFSLDRVTGLYEQLYGGLARR
jgi:glycosyltransferase involved in cell wall biosynthesis